MCRKTYEPRSFSLKNRGAMPSAKADDFIDLDRLLAAARRQIRVVALFARARSGAGRRLSRFHAAALHGIDQHPARRQPDQVRRGQASAAGRRAGRFHGAERGRDPEIQPPGANRGDDRKAPGQRGLPQSAALALGMAEGRREVGRRLRLPRSRRSRKGRAEDARIGKAIARLQAGLTAERVGRSFVIDVSFRTTTPSSPARSRAPMPTPIFPITSTPISTRRNAPPSGCRGGWTICATAPSRPRSRSSSSGPRTG